ncbi:uncharacterized protein SPSK_06536 [Sporothrix schenckii 1099-18]|uniref:Tyrosine specific protein phosphatases domain-containing protein n=1 Tax=Sporothrix schenckii 1099-18 TaxID=1397361 RepID=A0A0F2MH90_SPOSC|nr:uncharacterized protein SPSK_06536 [Sporothrix schenckii 1099-18]KJR89058.1 hypothetical protein SPSK_06536 [Sporothrix schenckii 1099-18]
MSHGPVNPETSTSLPSPPFIHLKGIPNFRDLGGYVVSSKSGTGTVRRGYIFRCGEPTSATPEAVDTVRGLGVTHIYDLRSLPEIQKLQVAGTGPKTVDWPGVTRVFTPVFRAESYDPVSLAKRYADYQDENPKGMVNAYRAILTEGAASYGIILRHILEDARVAKQQCFIIHCTAGKDRTGVLGALLLSVCGVPDLVVAEEYNLTEAGLGQWTELLVQAVLKQGATSEEGARRMVGARKDSMLDTLKMLREEFGGAAAYMETKCGLTKEEVGEIVDFLVVKE